MYYIIIGSVIFLAAIGIVIIHCYNNFQFAIIRITEAENNIDILLQKKLELLIRIKAVIEEKIKDSDFLTDFDEQEYKDLNHFETNRFLREKYMEVLKVIDENEKLLNDKALVIILEDLADNEEDLVAATKFYNDNVVEFNRLISSFPSNIVRLFMHLKKKEFYENEKQEMLEILKSS